MELKFNELFGNALGCLTEACDGSIEGALDTMRIRDKETRAEIKNWYSGGESRRLPTELRVLASDIGFDYSLCSEDDTVSGYLEEEYGHSVRDFSWEYDNDTAPGTPRYVIISKIEWEPLDRDDPELKKLYKAYLKEWKADHKGPEFEGMEPADFDEWYDNEYLESFEEDEEGNEEEED